MLRLFSAALLVLAAGCATAAAAPPVTRGDTAIDAEWAALASANPVGSRAVVPQQEPATGIFRGFGTRNSPAQQVAAPVVPRMVMDPAFLPAVVDFPTDEKPGTIIINPDTRYLYYVLEDGKAQRYGVGVGRDGFGWSGTVTVARKAEWPTWTPPAEMRRRQPHLPVSMQGGPENPLGARAMYLHRNGRDTLFRIHGSNQPWTIGQAVSSGCFRMRNEDVIELYSRVGIGTKVVVL